MLFIKSLVSVATLSSVASASYFYTPEWYCTLDEYCSPSKRNVEPSNNEAGLSMRVVRVPQPNSVQNARSSANKLIRKYQERSATHVQRANTYKIVSAATPSATNAIGVDQDGTDYSYFVQAGVGSANQPIYMLLDTGAGTTWVMGPSCTSDSCKSHNTYDPSKSTTFKDLGVDFSINYGSGNVSGATGQDTISMAGFKLSTTIGVAEYASDDFNHFPMDGILGLSLAKGDSPHFWESLSASKALKANIFGLDINRNSDGANDGLITFGAVDTTRFTGDINYYPVADNAEGDWAVAIGDVGVGTSKAGINGRLAYIDSGTSFIFGPPEDIKKFHALIPGATSGDGATYTVPCDTTDSAFFTFGSNTYSISPKDWVSPKVNGVCTSNFYGVNVVSETSWLVGDVFLKNVYAVFDYDKTRLGFASNAAAVASSSSASPSSSASSTSTSGQLAPSSSAAPSTTLVSSSLVSSSTTGPVSGSSTGSSLETQSNQDTTGSSSTIASSMDSSTSSAGAATTTHVTPGLNGHETPASSTGSAASVAASQATGASTPSNMETPKKSGTFRITTSSSSIVLAISVAVAFIFL